MSKNEKKFRKYMREYHPSEYKKLLEIEKSRSNNC